MYVFYVLNVFCTMQDTQFELLHNSYMLHDACMHIYNLYRILLFVGFRVPSAQRTQQLVLVISRDVRFADTMKISLSYCSSHLFN